MSTPAVTLEHAEARIAGRPVWSDVDVSVADTEFTAILGPNGSGKTTTIRVLLGLLRAEAGEVSLMGADPWKDAVPLYAHMGDKTVRLGTLGVTHSSEPVDITLAGKIDRVSINDYEDLLADVKE